VIFLRNLSFLRRLSVLVALGAFVAGAWADPIAGTITFTGSVTLNTTSVNTADRVTSWVRASVENVDGDFAAFTAPNASVTMAAPWLFDTTSPVASFWEVGGFHFDLISSQVLFQGYGFLAVEGSGMIWGNGFEPTSGTWSFTTQSPSARGSFSFSAGSDVPEAGTTLALLGSAALTLFTVGKLFNRHASACRRTLHRP
jgi:hypothetical protein